MLQQTQAARVIPRWEAFVERWPSPADLARAGDADVLRAWDRLGYPRRALWLRRCAVEIVEHHDGRVPATREDLLALPGIGPYTAAAVASFAFGVPEAVVDTNVRRVLARVEEGSEEPWAPNAARDLAAYRALVPAPPPDDATAVRRANRWNAAAMELGAIVCTARTPACERCPVAERCAWRRAGYPAGPTAGVPRRKQARYEGSDREMRGRILHELRATTTAVPLDALHDAVVRGGHDERFARALASLEADALVVVDDGAASLPS
ncbi:A/G-specific adenine glycosylase [Pseudoclavibacter chungangensis]|uniref:Adenine DNA glycosylase n=2 Tax=Pseudoclavibacter chungangensis TaxID=587635 RepID=A0A7J5BUZ0_9MICO|nr:A/G-specific adenine glycosylase [Pseudoclavibacter chungangensis]